MAATIALAGGLHVGVALEHGLTTRHGAFFLVLGAAQVALGALVARRPASHHVALSVAISAVAVSVWSVTRLLPLGQRETVGVLDVVATGLELLTIGGGVLLLRMSLRPRPTPALRTALLLVAAAVAATSTTLVPSSHADHHHGPSIREASARAGHDGDTVVSTGDEPMFGDLFADHHAASQAAGHGTGAEDADAEPHAGEEPHEHPPADHFGPAHG